MQVTKLSIPDVILIEPKVFDGSRGFFFESFNQKRIKWQNGMRKLLDTGMTFMICYYTCSFVNPINLSTQKPPVTVNEFN